MRPPAPRSQRLRQAREAEWRTLERLIGCVETQSVRSLSADQLVALPVLYRSALSSLSVARATSLDQDLVAYLEGLCTRAYFIVYGPRTTLVERAGAFFARDWPAAVRGLWPETLTAAALTLLGALLAYALTAYDPEWHRAFVSDQMSAGRTPEATTAFLRDTLYTTAAGKQNLLAVFAAFLFTHNAQVSVMAFALGFACGVPTAFLLVTNGAIAGAMFAVYIPHGLGWPFAAWLLIHGTTELFAVTLAGAAGLRIGWRLAFPGVLSRVDAVSAAGRQGALVMCGVIVMLMAAGILEGVGRQVITNDLVRGAIALGALAFWTAYFYRPPSRPGRYAP